LYIRIYDNAIVTDTPTIWPPGSCRWRMSLRGRSGTDEDSMAACGRVRPKTGN
jgi:hypothetical protein